MLCRNAPPLLYALPTRYTQRMDHDETRFATSQRCSSRLDEFVLNAEQRFC